VTTPDVSAHPLVRRHPWWTAGVLGLVVVLVVALVWRPWAGDDRPRLNTTACQPFDQPTTLAGLNDVTEGYRSQQGFRGGDVGASVQLQDGRALYVFGDTLRGPDYPGERFVRNSMLVFGAGCAGLVEHPDHGALIPDRDDGVGYWPMSVASVPRAGYDLVGVMAQRVRSTGGAQSQNFENLGPSVAVFRVDRGGTPQLQAVTDLGPDRAARTRPTWGAAAAVVGDRVYLYGTANPEDPMVFGWSLSVARTRLADIADPDRWEYWDGDEWGDDPDDAAELIDPVGGVSQTLSVFRSGDTWYALSKQDEFLGDKLRVWTAPSPRGPFTAQEPLASIPSRADGSLLQYMPLAHPDLLPEPGTMVVSVSRNTTRVGLVDQAPTLYRPRFLRVRLPVPAS
jgi:hypothetical protein